MAVAFTVNGKAVTSAAPENTPLLWVLREELKLTGTKFGCGAGQCGACMVHIAGERTFSCLTPVGLVAGKSVTTIEGLSPGRLNALQRAWLAENPHPTPEQIKDYMGTNVCRCGTYPRIVRAIERAAKEG